MDVRLAAYAVIVTDGRLLLTHWNEHGRNGWALPGGGLEHFETAEQAALREIREETGFDAELIDLLGVDSMYLMPADRAPGRSLPLHSFRVIYRARIVGGTLTHEVGGSSDEARWFDLTAVADVRTVTLVPIALALLQERTQHPSRRGPGSRDPGS